MIADMSDRTPTADQQDTSVGTDRADVTRQDATVAPTVTVIEAARMLGVSVDAVRSRLRRGTLEGEKIEGEWHVRLPDRQDADRAPAEPTGTQQDATGNRPERQQDTFRTPTVVDLSTLAELIERQGKELADLREAAAVWQIRARQAEERLLELSAGETTTTTSSEAPRSSRSDDQPLQGLRAWWRRLWGS